VRFVAGVCTGRIRTMRFAWRSEADKIGYPVLIKAVAGGGGKGMRWSKRRAGFQAALDRARLEAKTSFCAMPHVLVGNFRHQPRHIEVQVLRRDQAVQSV